MTRLQFRVFPIAVCLLLLIACGQEPPASSVSRHSSTTEAERIVALGGEISETLVRLGVENRIVAVDSTSTWPARLQNLPDVGYLRQLNTEGVLSLQPDLILASHEAGPGEVLDRWRLLGIPVQQVSTGPDIEEALASIVTLGEIVGKNEEARALVAENRRELAALPILKSEPTVLFILSKAGNLPLISGRGTKAHVMIERAGGRNIASTIQGYKPATTEAIVQMAPDVILVASHGLSSFGGIEALQQDPALRLTSAATNGNIHVVDSHLVLSMGPRLAEAVTSLHDIFANLQASDSPAVAQREPQ